jgi:PhnB protein
MQVQPYLVFEGRCEEAAEFYRKALGAEVTMLMRRKESPDPPTGGRRDAVDQDLLLLALRHGRRSLRRALDDRRGALRTGALSR